MDALNDVFFVYTKGDPYEAKLVESVKAQLYRWGLNAWVYEDWDWERECDTGPHWRSYGGAIQLDPLRFALRHPEPFRHRQTGHEVDRETLAWMFEQSGALVVIAERGGSISAGKHIELELLERAPHPAITSIRWNDENRQLVRDIESCFDYRMESMYPNDFSVAAESIARCTWLACMMAKLVECGPMGVDVARQLARSDRLLNLIAQRARRPVTVPLDADPGRAAVVAQQATAESCAPVVELWRGGPGFTANQLTSGKPSQDIIEASKLMRGMVHHWCVQVEARFPALAARAAKVSLPLGAAMLRLGRTRDAIDELTSGLAAPDAASSATSMLMNRALAWSELGLSQKSVVDYTAALRDETLGPQQRGAILYNRALVWRSAGRYAEAERDLTEVLSLHPLGVRVEALALALRGLVKALTDERVGAIADYDAVIQLSKAPVEARLQALINRGALHLQLGQHELAVRDWDTVVATCEAEPGQIALALYNRADAKTRLPDLPAARSDFEAALEQPGLEHGLREAIRARLRGLDEGAFYGPGSQ